LRKSHQPQGTSAAPAGALQLPHGKIATPYGGQATPVLDAQGMRETPRVRLNMRQ
jgi:hypothetical protein